MRFRQSNKGSVLAISLMILTAITLISISSLQRSGLQTRMVGNIKYKEETFHKDNNNSEGAFQYLIKGTNKNDPSAEAAIAFNELYEAANSDSNVINNKEVYDSISTSYNSNATNDLHSNIISINTLQFQNATRAPGYSEALFKNHNYHIISSSLEPSNTLGVADKTVSSQTLGVKFLAPAG